MSLSLGLLKLEVKRSPPEIKWISRLHTSTDNLGCMLETSVPVELKVQSTVQIVFDRLRDIYSTQYQQFPSLLCFSLRNGFVRQSNCVRLPS